MEQMAAHNIHLPLVAIGGILLTDVAAILQTGVTGIAVSGAILNAENPVEETSRFMEQDKVEK